TCNKILSESGSESRRRRSREQRRSTTARGARTARATRTARRSAPRSAQLFAGSRAEGLGSPPAERRSPFLPAQLPGGAQLPYRRLPSPGRLGAASLGVRRGAAAPLLGRTLHPRRLLAVRARGAAGRL